ncbi:hypothetical protein DBR32_02535 [Taibaiella sp. KBW10]|uniref:hypothetical protein n=1 Tax=Taibaiella sp. KBW10 TaxID=2153357 RepID=UPI000F593DD2|nr:hypothetical protein [Taibaiella sp. KBW10]RQO32498.1 hypothetical protein DBR32_02535 [Taibaiella sp. KBW10]
MKKLSIFALLIAGLAFTGCKKEFATEEHLPISLKTMSGTITNMPTVIDGMLYFETDDQYLQYVQGLKDAVENKEDDREDDEILNEIEASMGFNSLRKQRYTTFNIQNQTGWGKYEDIPEMNEIDKVDQSIFNTKSEYKIGNKVYKKMNHKYDIVVDLSSNNAVEILNGARVLVEETEHKGDITLSQIRNLDWTKKSLTILDLSINGWEITPMDENPTPLAEYELSGFVHEMNACGGTLNRMTVRSMTLVKTGTSTPYAAYYTVNYGDGTPGLVDYHATAGMFGVEYYDEHQYANAGTYTVTISAKLTPTGAILASQTYQVTVTNSGVCSKTTKEKVYTYEIDATHKLRCTIKYRNHWVFYRGWIVDGTATAEYYVKSGSTWKNQKATTLGVKVKSYAYKKDENNCILYTGTDASGLWVESDLAQNNKKSMTVGSKGHGPVVKYITIDAWFQVTVNNVIYNKLYTMTACD